MPTYCEILTFECCNQHSKVGTFEGLFSQIQLFMHYSGTEPVYYGHLRTSQKCPDYQGVLIFQVSLYDNVSFGTTARCVDYAGVHILKCPD